MISQSHDGLTQALGLRLNRRWFGAATLAGAVAAVLRGSGIHAQPEEKTCAFDLDATVVAGPNTGLSFQGSLTLPIGADGAIDEGEFVSANGLPSAVVGMATNRRLRLRIDLGDEGVSCAERNSAAHSLWLPGRAERSVRWPETRRSGNLVDHAPIAGVVEWCFPDPDRRGRSHANAMSADRLWKWHVRPRSGDLPVRLP